MSADMPSVNIPARVRFALYLLGVLGSVAVQYLLDVGRLGDAEQRAWAGLSAVLFALAAARVELAQPAVAAPPPPADVTAVEARDLTPDEYAALSLPDDDPKPLGIGPVGDDSDDPTQPS